MVGWFSEEGLIADTPPNVSAQENAGNPHYRPLGPCIGRFAPTRCVLIDLWGKLPTPGAVFADITWVGFTGANVAGGVRGGFAAARDGRDAAVELVQSAVRDGRELRGFEVDRACRDGRRARRIRGAVHPPHRAQPRRERPRQRRPHGRLRDARRPPADSRARALRLNRVSTPNRFGVRTEINMFVGEREARSRARCRTRSSR